jgi:hypothetical protein
MVVSNLLGRGYGTTLVVGSPVRLPAITRGWAMEIQHSMTDGCLVVAFTGSLDLVSASQVQRALLKDLSEGALCADLRPVRRPAA